MIVRYVQLQPQMYRRKVLGGGGGGSETCSDGRVYEKERREVRVYES